MSCKLLFHSGMNISLIGDVNKRDNSVERITDVTVLNRVRNSQI